MWLKAKGNGIIHPTVPMVAVARQPVDGAPDGASELQPETGARGGGCSQDYMHEHRVPAQNVGGNSAESLVQQVRNMVMTGDYMFLLIELGCADDSELAANVREHCLAVRITAKVDLTKKSTKKLLHALIRFCALFAVEVHIWVSIPCTRGEVTVDVDLTNSLIAAAVSLCEHAARSQNTL
eukprot:1133748-Pyramimonas_sp.AAC.1